MYGLYSFPFFTWFYLIRALNNTATLTAYAIATDTAVQQLPTNASVYYYCLNVFNFSTFSRLQKFKKNSQRFLIIYLFVYLSKIALYNTTCIQYSVLSS